MIYSKEKCPWKNHNDKCPVCARVSYLQSSSPELQETGYWVELRKVPIDNLILSGHRKLINAFITTALLKEPDFYIDSLRGLTDSYLNGRYLYTVKLLVIGIYYKPNSLEDQVLKDYISHRYGDRKRTATYLVLHDLDPVNFSYPNFEVFDFKKNRSY